ncbi:hypothetical protein L195_g029511 [Trifolium pratense]|uniref:Uncharacterized protein n=1 Tax=Trifolium pratense TaxID=57577 RepID=A0A2K3L511_TRIPR|nr:hypothetical protein L195_g029511 [Trifolium pratense]
MLLFFEVFFAFTFLYTMPNRENEAAIEHLGLVTANVVVSNMMISMVDSTIMIVTIVLWVLVLVLDIIFLAKDAFHQLWEKRLYWLPKSEKTLEEQIRIAEEALERARDLRSRAHVFYQEARQR